MTAQCLRLKRLLRKHGILDMDGLTPRVQTTKNGLGEWDDAITVVRQLSKEECQALLDDDHAISGVVFTKHGYTFLRSGHTKGIGFETKI